MPDDLRTLPKKFGASVRATRTKAGLTQMELAERADLAPNYIGEIERGEKLASLETLVRLSRALGTSCADLLIRAGLNR